MESAPAPTYAGLVTRAVAFVIDAALVNGIAFAVGAGLGLALSIFGVSLDELPEAVSIAVGAGGWAVLNVAYFAGSWALTGQTTGMRLMTMRVLRTDGGRVRLGHALRRVVGMVVAALPLFAGYLLILVDDRRRGLHDRIAGTVVVFLTEAERTARTNGRSHALRPGTSALPSRASRRLPRPTGPAS
jgi:uncharacterized RDD family membrane protein YckC